LVLVSQASNQNQNQHQTMTLVWFGFDKPWFWFAGFLVSNQTKTITSFKHTQSPVLPHILTGLRINIAFQVFLSKVLGQNVSLQSVVIGTTLPELG
jgi:hypothetical protein